ncbi:phosphonate C-P lyase system protein PhnH [Rhodopseudomonas palustris]|uniref:phosphonate C-P lyase system protein PhnH n=1 Tax=Rhodopseudomonas palustris TaxID=1076 RepID=UPI002ACD968A|nr:phosphonate C-P lyase system protein PhnH [Rhodopseudomonas palustris]WQG97773.1 phosphonate C-P lyase system protein PhnH [Rhodopseudomonas palustris]
MTGTVELSAGFADKVTSAQATFRAVMQAMARPGKLQRLDAELHDVPAPLMPATAAIALTLFDHDTPLWLDAAAKTPAVTRWLRFHTSAPLVEAPEAAAFALIAEPHRMPALDRFALGSNDYPDRSTTLVLQLESLEEGAEFELSGPGIRGMAALRAPLPESLVSQHEANHALFPRGADLILVGGDTIVAIPRTTRLVAKGGN